MLKLDSCCMHISHPWCNASLCLALHLSSCYVLKWSRAFNPSVPTCRHSRSLYRLHAKRHRMHAPEANAGCNKPKPIQAAINRSRYRLQGSPSSLFQNVPGLPSSFIPRSISAAKLDRAMLCRLLHTCRARFKPFASSLSRGLCTR